MGVLSTLAWIMASQSHSSGNAVAHAAVQLILWISDHSNALSRGGVTAFGLWGEWVCFRNRCRLTGFRKYRDSENALLLAVPFAVRCVACFLHQAFHF